VYRSAFLLVNQEWEEPVQTALDDRSRMSREVHVRICEGVGVRLPRATRLVVVAPSRTVLAQHVLPTFARFLADRGLHLSEAKTHIVHSTEGFNFLGCEIRRFPRALLTQPQKTKMRGHYRAITTYLLYSRAGRSTHHGDCRVVFGLMSGHVLV
jgi:hypothetical protein